MTASSSRDPGSSSTDGATGQGERVTHFVMLLSLGSLVAVYGLPRLAEPTFWPGGLVILLLQIAPLLACIPTALRGSVFGTSLLSLLALIYFMFGVWTVVDPAERLLGIAEIVFSVSLFFSAAWFSRVRGLRLKHAAAASAEADGRREDS